MSGEVYRSASQHTSPPRKADGAVDGITTKTPRRPPSEQEQARRKEWAAVWSQVGKEHAKQEGWK